MTIYRIDGRSTTSKYAVDIIEAAPGFTGEGTYDLLRTKSGGYRVYKVVGDMAMDASLKDIPEESLKGLLGVQAAELAGATWMESVLTECDEPDEWLVMDYQEFLQAAANANRPAFPSFETTAETDAAYQGAWGQLESTRRLHAADKVYHEDLEKRKLEGWKDYDGK
jgi:hypothetical protein